MDASFAEAELQNAEQKRAEREAAQAAERERAAKAAKAAAAERKAAAAKEAAKRAEEERAANAAREAEKKKREAREKEREAAGSGSGSFIAERRRKSLLHHQAQKVVATMRIKLGSRDDSRGGGGERAPAPAPAAPTEDVDAARAWLFTPNACGGRRTPTPGAAAGLGVGSQDYVLDCSPPGPGSSGGRDYTQRDFLNSRGHVERMPTTSLDGETSIDDSMQTEPPQMPPLGSCRGYGSRRSSVVDWSHALMPDLSRPLSPNGSAGTYGSSMPGTPGMPQPPPEPAASPGTPPYTPSTLGLAWCDFHPHLAERRKSVERPRSSTRSPTSRATASPRPRVDSRLDSRLDSRSPTRSVSPHSRSQLGSPDAPCPPGYQSPTLFAPVTDGMDASIPGSRHGSRHGSRISSRGPSRSVSPTRDPSGQGSRQASPPALHNRTQGAVYAAASASPQTHTPQPWTPPDYPPDAPTSDDMAARPIPPTRPSHEQLVHASPSAAHETKRHVPLPPLLPLRPRTDLGGSRMPRLMLNSASSPPGIIVPRFSSPPGTRGPAAAGASDSTSSRLAPSRTAASPSAATPATAAAPSVASLAASALAMRSPSAPQIGMWRGKRQAATDPSRGRHGVNPAAAHRPVNARLSTLTAAAAGSRLPRCDPHCRQAAATPQAQPLARLTTPSSAVAVCCRAEDELLEVPVGGVFPSPCASRVQDSWLRSKQCAAHGAAPGSPSSPPWIAPPAAAGPDLTARTAAGTSACAATPAHAASHMSLAPRGSPSRGGSHSAALGHGGVGCGSFSSSSYLTAGSPGRREPEPQRRSSRGSSSRRYVVTRASPCRIMLSTPKQPAVPQPASEALFPPPPSVDGSTAADDLVRQWTFGPTPASSGLVPDLRPLQAPESALSRQPALSPHVSPSVSISVKLPQAPGSVDAIRAR